ncbi:MAG TPA: dihydrolipoyl dehydrogenase, partial [Spirochaetia bacterium]|nr:dihydrolipoyl dehydrogenase [Spirochaetia bacterium]
MAEKETVTQLAIIGAGPGGYAAAFLAADLGLAVTLIDPELNPGGVCLHRGCIPAKVLLHIAQVIDEAREAQKWGVTFGTPEIDVDRIRDWKNQVVAGLTKGLGQLTAQRKITYLRGRARFVESTLLEVTTEKGDKVRLRAENVIIATGSVSTSLPGLDFSSPLVMDSEAALDLPDIPKRLLVIGAGYIGLEMGTVYAALGSEVTVAEMMNDILPMADKDLVREYKKHTAGYFKEFITGARAETKIEGKKVNAVFRLAENRDQVIKEAEFDKVLLTVGRKPNTMGLGLEHTTIELDEKGFIKVNAERRTTDPAVFAIG